MPGTRPKTGPWPSPRYVFLGDNGKSEKDFEAATRIVDAFPKELQARATAPSAAALSAAAPPLPSAGSSPTAGCPAAGCPCARSRAAAVAQAVFLHAVSGETQPAPLPEDSEYRGVPVMHYRTYATAAVKAFDRRLLDADAARRARTATHRHRTATATPHCTVRRSPLLTLMRTTRRSTFALALTLALTSTLTRWWRRWRRTWR